MKDKLLDLIEFSQAQSIIKFKFIWSCQIRLVLKLIGIYLVVNVVFKVTDYYDFITMQIDGESIKSDVMVLALSTKTNEIFWINAWSIFSALMLVIMYIIDRDDKEFDYEPRESEL